MRAEIEVGLLSLYIRLPALNLHALRHYEGISNGIRASGIPSLAETVWGYRSSISNMAPSDTLKLKMWVLVKSSQSIVVLILEIIFNHISFSAYVMAGLVMSSLWVLTS